jgi:hypothetical protein
MSTETWLATAFGGVFIALLFATAIWLIATGKPVPATAEWLLRVIMALAGAGCGALLSGMLTVDLHAPQLAIKATSGFAVFVLIYLVNPPRHIMQRQTVAPGGTGVQIIGDKNDVRR